MRRERVIIMGAAGRDFHNFNMVYRAYRVPYDYVPQLKVPKEEPIIPPENHTLRLKDLTTKK